MSDETPTPLVTAAEIDAAPALTVTHPLNPDSEVHLRWLSRRAGMQRVHLTLARIPPGKESFIYHSHAAEEEFVYILSGRGRAEVGDEVFEVGPGDFLGFPTPSVGHHLTNPYDEDLVYLMGGEQASVEVAEFPRAGKVLFRRGEEVFLADRDAVEHYSMADWIKANVKESG